jgi:hypothetical protein
VSPFEALYGRRYRTPFNWSESGEWPFFGPNLVNVAQAKVRQIQGHLRVAQSRQKRYVDRCRAELYFNVGDYVYLKWSENWHLTTLALLRSSQDMVLWHTSWNFHHLSLMCTTCSMFINWSDSFWVPSEAIAMDTLDLQPDLSYVEYPLRILDEAECKLRNCSIKFVKVQWNNHSDDEAT